MQPETEANENQAETEETAIRSSERFFRVGISENFQK
jgi:hypothetical protein